MTGGNKSRRMAGCLVLACAAVIAACGGGGGGGAGAGTGGGTGGAASGPALTAFAGMFHEKAGQDGPALSAQFNRPNGVAMDDIGNVYVADAGNHTVRRIGIDGEVSTVAGVAGQFGSVDGPANQARFIAPMGVALDSAGTLYVADSGNYTIRKITPEGVVSTVAGIPGQLGRTDGGPGVGKLLRPLRVAIDARTGNLYVADEHGLRKVTPGGVISTVTRGLCSAVWSVVVDRQGGVYVSESANDLYNATGCVRKFDSQGAAVPLGGAADGALRLPGPADLAVDTKGNLFVASSGSYLPNGATTATVYSSILKVAPDGSVTTVVGATNDSRPVDGAVAQARVARPSGVAVHASGRVVFSELLTASIRQIDTKNVVSTIAGGAARHADGQGTAARLWDPWQITAAPDGAFYVADSRNNRVRKISATGAVSTVPITPVEGSSDVFVWPPVGVAVDGQGVIYVGESLGRMLAIDGNGRARLLGTRSVGLNAPLAATKEGKVYFGNGLHVETIDASGARQIAGSGFTEPAGFAFARDGRLYVADVGNHTVYAVEGGGAIRLVAGQVRVPGSADGEALKATLNRPTALAFDDAGNLYIADATTIRKLTPQGMLSKAVDIQAAAGAANAVGSGGPVRGMVWSGGNLLATMQNAVVKIGPLN